MHPDEKSYYAIRTPELCGITLNKEASCARLFVLAVNMYKICGAELLQSVKYYAMIYLIVLNFIKKENEYV